MSAADVPEIDQAVDGVRNRSTMNSSAAAEQTADTSKGAPLYTLEVSQVDILRIDRVDPLTHTFHASLFLALVLRKGALDENLMNEESTFPRPSAKWFWDKIEVANAVSIDFKDVQPVRREGDDLVLRFRFAGEFVEVMELQEFPFDVQALTFSITLKCAIALRTQLLAISLSKDRFRDAFGL